MSNVIEIQTPDATEISNDATKLAFQCGALEVTDKGTHKAGLEYISGLKVTKTAIISLFADAKKQANKAHKSIVAAEKRLLTPVEDALNDISRKCLNYAREEAARADAARREAEEAARKAAEESQLAAAQAAEDSGQKELADAILDSEPVVPIIAPEPEVAKVEGVSTRTTWSAEITDFKALVQHVAKNPNMLGLLKADTTKLNGMARSLREGLDIPGVRAVPKQSLATRAETQEQAW